MDSDVIVIGAGPAGLCLARALALRGLDTTVVERQPLAAIAEPAFDGREIALTHASMRILRELGVWQRLAADEIAPLRRARVIDGDDAGFEVDAAAFGRDRLGVLVSNQSIRRAAWAAIDGEARVRVCAAATVAAVGGEATHAWLRLADGTPLHAPLLVAADSRFSETRRAMGIAADLHDFGRSMLVCRIAHADPHHGVAWEWFGRGQTRALLPLREHLASAVLTVPGDEAQRLAALPPDAFARELEARYEGRLGAIELASTVHAYPLVSTWAHAFVAGRCALAGDAAVGMHPVTAHGFNLGLAGVARLADAIAAGVAQHGDAGHPLPLARYERAHRRESRVLYAGTRAVVELFGADRTPLRPLRRAVLGTMRALPPLRRALAAGLIDEARQPASVLRHARIALDVLRPRFGNPGA